uniref:PDZ domain-containing protein n=1 Tax=Parascaris equorum TaxID=6256 RepID=A0A914R8T7_PAREQ
MCSVFATNSSGCSLFCRGGGDHVMSPDRIDVVILYASITGGAVALDGRIEVGDQIVQVNKNSFENLSDAQAVQLLRQAAVSRRQNSVKPLKPFATDETNSIVVENTLGEEEHETDMEGAYAERHDRIQIPPTSNKGRTTQVVTTKRGVITAEDVFMARPDSGLQIKNRKWLKIPFSYCFMVCLMEGEVKRKVSRGEAVSVESIAGIGF